MGNVSLDFIGCTTYRSINCCVLMTCNAPLSGAKEIALDESIELLCIQRSIFRLNGLYISMEIRKIFYRKYLVYRMFMEVYVREIKEIGYDSQYAPFLAQGHPYTLVCC